MDKASKWGVIVAPGTAAVEIFITVAAFSRLESVFQVIVVSLLGFTYLGVVELRQVFDEYRVSMAAGLHKEFSIIKQLSGGTIDEETGEQVKEMLETKSKYEAAEVIAWLGHLAIFLIIVWKFVAAVFFS